MINPEIERRDLNTRPVKGDIVEVTWSDHFSYSGNTPPQRPVVARSWGKLDLENEEGVALTHTEVIEQPEYPVDSIHNGQFIIRSTMKEIKKANGHNK